MPTISKNRSKKHSSSKKSKRVQHKHKINKTKRLKKNVMKMKGGGCETIHLNKYFPIGINKLITKLQNYLPDLDHDIEIDPKNMDYTADNHYIKLPSNLDYTITTVTSDNLNNKTIYLKIFEVIDNKLYNILTITNAYTRPQTNKQLIPDEPIISFNNIKTAQLTQPIKYIIGIPDTISPKMVLRLNGGVYDTVQWDHPYTADTLQLEKNNYEKPSDKINYTRSDIIGHFDLLNMPVHLSDVTTANTSA